MNILFATFGLLSVGEGAIRSVSLLRAMADAGHNVDVIAGGFDLCPHPNIHVLNEDQSKTRSRRKIRVSTLKALRRKRYDVVHLVDDTILYLFRSRRMKRVSIVYEAHRCFFGANGSSPAWHWRLMSKQYCQILEKRALARSSIVFSSCEELTADLRRVEESVKIVQVDDIPAHPLFPKKDPDRIQAIDALNGGARFLVVCSVQSVNPGELRAVLMAARKVIERIPEAGFFFKGISAEQAKPVVESLDIQSRCVFLPAHETPRFLEVLAVADTALFFPRMGQRYRHPEILTLLNSPALVVAVRDGAYASLLNEKNCVQVECTATAIADGLMRGIREPLLSFGIVADAQAMIANKHSFSTFKHKVRMAYHEMLNVH